MARVQVRGVEIEHLHRLFGCLGTDGEKKSIVLGRFGEKILDQLEGPADKVGIVDAFEYRPPRG
jgi:hypothetical protein